MPHSHTPRTGCPSKGRLWAQATVTSPLTALEPRLPQHPAGLGRSGGAQGVVHGHTANPGRPGPLLPPPPHPTPAHVSPPLEHANGAGDKENRTMCLHPGERQPPRSASRGPAREQLPGHPSALPAPPVAAARERETARHLPGPPHGLAGARSLSPSRHLLTPLATPGRSDPGGATFQNQELPARGRGAKSAWGWRALRVVPGARAVCPPFPPGAQHLGGLGCSPREPGKTAPGTGRPRQRGQRPGGVGP